ncbi:methyltransferase domain-containing protein [Paeniclostridium sp. NSJ-45]|uniref:Methyltransferase domain-containing protein n=1 Tax=Paeniclostridium hominis TaxID=2764329 RepID=A0ABR7K2R0_9FIRM|nr:MULTISPECIES: methyltransferase domain-containing protein [Paeniclostridium]MBC6003200.1 methyltransferase domain-containing protein [Paeniclostridium hominis]
MNQRDFFDNISKEWDNIIEVNKEKINTLLSKLDIKENERVLDVGTGTGVLIPFIKKLNKNGYIRGVDFSNGMLEVARKKYKHIQNLDFEIIDVENEVIKEKYNKIILYSMFPHLENKTKTIKTLVKNNLSENGKLMIAHSNSREFLNNMHKEKNEAVSEARLIPIDNQVKLFEDIGLNVVEAFENDQMYYLVLSNN